MNLPEYRAAINAAQVKFRNAVEEASEVLQKELMAADVRFFEEPAMAVEVDDDRAVRVRR